MDLPLMGSFFLNKCVLIGNEQGVVFEGNNKSLKGKYIEEDKFYDFRIKLVV